MTLTNKYYLTFLITGPALALLIGFSNMNMFLSLGLGIVTQTGLTMAGYYLGKRDNND